MTYSLSWAQQMMKLVVTNQTGQLNATLLSKVLFKYQKFTELV